MSTPRYRIIYVASPYRGNFFKRLRNIHYARKCSLAVWDSGNFPITPHLLYPQFLPEVTRRVILKSLLPICDALWAFVDYGLSPGMIEEIEIFKQAGKPVLLLGVKDIWNFEEIHARYIGPR